MCVDKLSINDVIIVGTRYIELRQQLRHRFRAVRRAGRREWGQGEAGREDRRADQQHNDVTSHSAYFVIVKNELKIVSHVHHVAAAHGE